MGSVRRGIRYLTNEIFEISTTNKANASAVWPVSYMAQVIVTG